MEKLRDKIIIDRVVEYLIENNIDFKNHDLIRNIKARKEGRVFNFEDNIKGLIYAFLGNQRKWKDVAPQLKNIDKLFFQYDKNKILSTPAEYFYNGIFELKCGNVSTKKQMESLAYDIHIFEKIEDDYGSLNNFYETYPADKIAKMISSGKYKLKYIGYALAWEFLRHVGIDGAKPDLHMRRILGNDRLGYSNSSITSETEVIEIFDSFAKNTGYLKSYLDIVLWSYCADGYGEICTASPKCYECVIREFCNYPSKPGVNIEEIKDKLLKDDKFKVEYNKLKPKYETIS